MSKKSFLFLIFLSLIAFLIPIEHKYDKLFRFFSLKLIPDNLAVSASYEKKIYFYLSDIFASFLLICALFLKRISFRKILLHPLFFVWMFALFSILVSPFAKYPIPYTRLLQLFTPVALVCLIENGFTKEELKKITTAIFFALMIAGIFQALIAILQVIKQGPIGLRLFSEINQFGTLTVDGGSRWLFDDLFSIKRETNLIIRAQGTLPHPNVFGGFLLFSLFASFAFFLQKPSKWILAVILLQFFALSLSYSRSALFAFAIASAIWFFFMRKQNPALLKKLIFTICLSLFISFTLLGKQYAYRGGVFNYTQAAKGSDEIRKYHQKKSKEILLDHPFFGLGLTQFSERSQSYLKDHSDTYVQSTAPHNMFLFLACEMGLFALTFLVFYLGSSLKLIFNAEKTPETITFFSLAIGFCFIGFCDFYPILFQQGKLIFFLILSLFIANAKQSVLKTYPIYERSVA